MPTDHTAYVNIDDQSDYTILHVMLVHFTSDHAFQPECVVWTNSNLSGVMSLQFQSGFGAGDDYWGILAYIQIKTNEGPILRAIGNLSKMCNFTGEDANGTGSIRFSGTDINNFSVTIVPPKSSNCDFLVRLVPTS